MGVCPGYLPPFQKQLDGTALGGSNCTCASAAMAAADDTCGVKHPTSSQVRGWTADTSGGTNLAQVDQALRTFAGVDLDVRYRLPWFEFIRRVNGGAGAILQGWYKPIRDSRFRGSESFAGNHAIYVNPGLVAMDPLADGRRAGIYKYVGEAYPERLLRDFAGGLNIGGSTYRALGDGLCYAAFTRDNEPAYKAVVRAGTYGVYNVVNGVIQPPGARVATTGGFSATCTAPRLYSWAGHTSQSLVRLTSGSHSGQYIRSSWAKEV